MAKRSRRSDVFHHNEVGVAHCVQRCVRRAFLAGKDPVTGKPMNTARLDPETDGIACLGLRARCVDLCRDVQPSPHHAPHAPRCRQNLNDEEIARRWLRLFPGRRLEDFLGEPTKQDIANAIGNAKKIAEWRKRLSDISWFMRALAEPIARKANKEDKCTGRFWEGRFKAQKIADEAGLLACAMYVDLNPVRAPLRNRRSNRSSLRPTIESCRNLGIARSQPFASLMLIRRRCNATKEVGSSHTQERSATRWPT